MNPTQIDWVFCWSTVTGGVADGARDAIYNGRPVPYRPDAREPKDGLMTVVQGRGLAYPRPLLHEQGTVSRMCCFVGGYVTHGRLVPAQTERHFESLRDLARGAVNKGLADEWAVARIHAGGEELLAVHLRTTDAILTDIARRVEAPWTLDVREDDRRMMFVARARGGRELTRLEGKAGFAGANLPRSVAVKPRIGD